MDIDKILSPKLTCCHIKHSDTKKLVLQSISQLICDTDENVKYTDILESLQKREKLGSTAIGNGVAIPHARVLNLTEPKCALLTLETPIDFDSTEDNDTHVDIIFSLFVPEDAPQAHLEILSTIAQKLKDQHYCESLRNAKTDNELYQAATNNHLEQ